MKLQTMKGTVVFLFFSAALMISSCKEKKEEKEVTTTTHTEPAPKPDAEKTVTTTTTTTETVSETQVKDATKDYPGVTATVKDGEVTLSGTINQGNLVRLMQSIQALNPKKVNNNLTVKIK